MVLDDVVNSLDANHRAALASLLTEEFSDTQLLVLTHDQIWFDILRRMAPDWQQVRLGHWSYELGVQIDIGVAQHEQIFMLLDEGQIETAGNLCRRVTERRLKWLCEHLGTPVPFRMGYENERRTPEDMFSALTEQVKTRKRFTGRDDEIWIRFRTSPFISNLASHDPAQVSVPLSSGDIRLAWQLGEELEAVFKCQNCNKWVWFASTNALRHESQCGCGQLEFA
jgi:hypothetical protein